MTLLLAVQQQLPNPGGLGRMSPSEGSFLATLTQDEMLLSARVSLTFLLTFLT